VCKRERERERPLTDLVGSEKHGIREDDLVLSPRDALERNGVAVSWALEEEGSNYGHRLAWRDRNRNVSTLFIE